MNQGLTSGLDRQHARWSKSGGWIPGPCRLFLKLENQNPGGSIKDRVALAMIEAAEREGRLAQGGLIVEATAGNTGLGLALVAAQKGYRLLIVVPDKMSQEKIFHLKAMGAEVVMTRSDVTKGHPEYYQDMAARLAQEKGAFYVNQFANPANPNAHEETTGPEIWQQMEHKVDAVSPASAPAARSPACRASSRASRRRPRWCWRIRRLDPRRISSNRQDRQSGLLAGRGHRRGLHPAGLRPFARAEGLQHPRRGSVRPRRDLLRKEGIMAGTSSGTLIAAALRYCREQTEPKSAWSAWSDSGNKYLSKVYNDYWMIDQGFIERETYGDLRDLIARGATRSTRWQRSAPTRPCSPRYQRMKLYDVSQLPVLQDGKIVGIVDEEDILLGGLRQSRRTSEPVTEAMESHLVTVPPSASVEQLMEIFKRGLVAIVVDGDEFLGLITRIDLLNWLRRRTQQ